MTMAPTDVLDARPSGQWRDMSLIVLEGPGAGRPVRVSKLPFVIGKDPAADWCIKDASVSRKHCVIAREQGRLVLRDLGSTNGTEVDGLRVREVELHAGARLKLGAVVLVFQPVFQTSAMPPAAADRFGALRGKSAAMRQVFAVFDRVAPTDTTVLLMGETGTGKGAATRALHAASARASQPLITLDCGAVSRSLIESELFGHEKGAFTGATTARQGAAELANGGTLFLDEIDDMPLELQPKLLRLLEDREVQRLGARRPTKLDIRVIAASKKDLQSMVAAGEFRQDLYFRLSVVAVELPPLRARRDDIPALADGFLGKDGAFDALGPALKDQLMHHTWSGNVRELRNVLERVATLGMLGGLPLGPGAPFGGESMDSGEGFSAVDFDAPFKQAKEGLVDSFERAYLERLLARSGHNIAQAAREAGLDRRYFYDLMKKHGLRRET